MNSGSIFERLGTKPVINACGIYTDLGGSVFSPRVWAAMEEINRSFVSMVDLLEKSGRVLAGLMGTEAARVAPGASAAIALGTAACMTGMDGPSWERLPDTTGMKNEVVMQRGHRYKYARCARLTGARITEAGDDHGTTLEQLSAAIGPNTAVILFPAHLGGKPGTVGLREVTNLGRERGVPTLVDAAYMNYPTEIMRSFSVAGADLVCFSAKYFWGPNSGGFICGRRDLIDAVAGVDFTRYESGKYLSFGRPFKLDRHIIVATVVALEEWLALDHKARWENYRRKVETIMNGLRGAPGLTLTPRYFTMDERLEPEPVSCLAIKFDPRCGWNAQKTCDALAAGDPRIATGVLDDVLVVAVDTVLDGQERMIAERLAAILSANGPKQRL
jgi:D-glucosaminate-6-phosphate ammonia-lyase